MEIMPLEQERSVDDENRRRFGGLRSLQWRVNLGILPSSDCLSVDLLRRVTADSRRRYAGLRKCLLVDPHNPKDGLRTRNLVMDNPLSQNPDSTWSRFFQNAELEKMVDQDLSRLYPEHGNYFQETGCQGMLRRILSMWCLRHPDCGYRQGMHELLAPLLYVLQADMERLSEVRKLHEDHFTDKIDGMLLEGSNATYNCNLKKSVDSGENDVSSAENANKVKSLDELDQEIQTIILLCDAYGAEGELGVVFSEKFMEHDAYCMFDALMSGSNGAVAMADFFSYSSAGGSQSNLPPVIEASAALYHLLSIVDSSIHSHLVELGVEPQYFALRWLRVLFGREFTLANLLIIWDEIFASENKNLNISNDSDIGFRILVSCRGAFISSIAVSMILYLRSSLLATEHATSCLQRLLNFPENVDLNKLIEKAKSLQILALKSNVLSSINNNKPVHARGRSLQLDLGSPGTPQNVVPESYWEEQWRNKQEEEMKKGVSEKQNPSRRRGWTDKVKLRLSRTGSDPLPVNVESGRKNQKSSVRRNLLEDLSFALGSEEDGKNDTSNGNASQENQFNDNLTAESGVKRQDSISKDIVVPAEKRLSSGKNIMEESQTILSDQRSPLNANGGNEHENDSERSSVASNLSPEESYDNLRDSAEKLIPKVCNTPEDLPLKPPYNDKSTEKSVGGLKERKVSLGKFQWIWKFGRNAAGEGPSGKGEGSLDVTKSVSKEGTPYNTSGPSTAVGSCSSFFSGREDNVDHDAMDTLKNLGQSMVEHIQVIESALQQDCTQGGLEENIANNVTVDEGQVTALEALKELRRISNMLSEV